MQKLILILSFLCLNTILHAQSPNYYQVIGKTVDSTMQALPFSTVMLIAQKDSALIHFTRSDLEGNFTFKNLRKGNFFVKTSFVGYKPIEKLIQFGEDAQINMGNFVMKPIAMELMEVVIKEARAPLEIRGDTIEYNASTFKVPEGSSVEDLLRKLPGVMVDADGNIKAQGKDIKKVTVDGKSFFGDDPKLATKNLPAEAISKVQVFDTQTEQSKATGVDDGKKEKTMNLELKDEFKNGGFGKLTAGLGTPERYEAKGNYNKFDAKHQFSLIGLVNNTNQTGMSWNDYQDFRGASAYNSFSDNADFGFGGSGRYFMFSDEENSESLNIPVGGQRGRGFSKNYALGGNYNYDNKKNKFNSSYYFNATEQTLDALRDRQSFIPNNNFETNEDSKQLNKYGNHRLALRLEKDIDSLHKLTVISNSRLGQTNLSLNSGQKFFTGGNFLSSQSNLNNSGSGTGISTSNSVIFRKKMKKKGRSVAVSGSYIFNMGENSAFQNSTNYFYQFDTLAQRIAQANYTFSTSHQYKASAIYIEPLSKKFYWETFANVGLRNEKVDRRVYDRLPDMLERLDSLSSYYTSEITFTRSGTSLRYSHNGVNLAVGLGVQRFNMQGRFANAVNRPNLAEVNRSFITLLPNVSVNLDLPNNKYLYFGYDVNVNQPTTKNLQPVIDNANPLFIQKGNPDLLPETTHELSLGLNMFNPASFFNLNVGLNANYAENQIVYNQKVDAKTLVTTISPENLSGRKSIGSYLYTGFPVVKTKLTLNFNFSPNIYQAPTFINGVKNETFGQNYNVGAGFSFTPADFFNAYGNVGFNYNKAEFSLASALPQEFYSNTYRLEANVKLPASFFLSTSLNVNTYLNERANFNQSVALLNASFYKLLGKAKKAELRLSAYDIFNQNLGIQQSVNQNFASREVVQTLARYFMLSFSYNMRGMKADIRKSNGW